MQVQVPRYEPVSEYVERLRNENYYWLSDQKLVKSEDEGGGRTESKDGKSNASKDPGTSTTSEGGDEYFYFSNYVRCPKVAFGTGTRWIPPKQGQEGEDRAQSSFQHQAEGDGGVESRTKDGRPSAVDETGAGEQEIVDPVLVEAIVTALDSGIRHIDTADYYRQERSVGEAIRVWLKKTGRAREELFITTKYWPHPLSSSSDRELSDLSADIVAALCRSLTRLQIDYVDLYLLHNPFNGLGIDKALYGDAAELVEEKRRLLDHEDIVLDTHEYWQNPHAWRDRDGNNMRPASSLPPEEMREILFNKAASRSFAARLDLFLSRLAGSERRQAEKLRGAWKRMEDLALEGFLCRSIGVSNFSRKHVDWLVFEDTKRDTGVVEEVSPYRRARIHPSELTNENLADHPLVAYVGPRPNIRSRSASRNIRCRIVPVCNQIEAHLHYQPDTEIMRELFSEWFGLRDDQSILPKCFAFGALFPLRTIAPGEADIDTRRSRPGYPESDPERVKYDSFGIPIEESASIVEVDTNPDNDPLAVYDYEPPFDEENCWEKGSEDSEDTRDRKKRKRHRLRLKDQHDLERNPPIVTAFERSRALKLEIQEMARSRETTPEKIVYTRLAVASFLLVATKIASAPC
ncbi:unnamed protein product [Amoebophrya sp. A25]|nr:unnamed protein product [Amoebophrya sp. A25]|eukprot:GSA25T00008836001.1